MADEKHTLVEDGSEIRGTMNSSCPVTVKGALDGELDAPAVTVTDTGTVRGRLRTKALHTAGTVGGEIEAEVVVLSGTVEHDTLLRADTIEVELGKGDQPGARFGTCRIEVGDPDQAGAAVQPAEASPTTEESTPASMEPPAL